MAGTASQAPIVAPATARPGQAAMDFINGHGTLPDSPASSSAPPPPAAKKGKGKKAVDPNETGKLLAAKINQLELDAAEDKEQEAEIGGYTSIFVASEMLCTFMGGISVFLVFKMTLKSLHLWASAIGYLPLAIFILHISSKAIVSHF